MGTMGRRDRMEAISRASLESALTVVSEPSPKSLSDGEFSELAVLTAQMVQRYPSQDTEVSLEGYLTDFEQLALKHSLAHVKQALMELRIRPNQQFFPRPDEVAAEIDRQREAKAHEVSRKEMQAVTERYDADFWGWVDSRMQDPDTAGMTEQQFLDGIKQPGYTGRRARVPANH